MIGDNCHVVTGPDATEEIDVTFDMAWKLSGGKRVASATSIEDAETYQQRLSARKRRHSEISEMDD